MRDVTTSTAPRPPGRPRSSRADGSIIDAVLEMLADGTTVEALSIEAIASRAGVGKATIYRRWPHKYALVVDAVASTKPPLPELAGESVRDDLVAVLSAMTSPPDERAVRILPCIVPELHRHGELRDSYLAMVEDRRDVTRAVIRRGIATGELRADTDVELVVSLLGAPMLVMSLMGGSPRLDRERLPERIVDTVLGGIAGPAARGDRPPGVTGRPG